MLFERQLESAITAAQAGEYDGNEVAVDGSDGTLYMYGPDADKLFAAIRPALEACSFMKGALVRLRYGPPADGVPSAKSGLPPNSLERHLSADVLPDDWSHRWRHHRLGV